MIGWKAWRAKRRNRASKWTTDRHDVSIRQVEQRQELERARQEARKLREG